MPALQKIGCYKPDPGPEVEFCLRESYSFRAGPGIFRWNTLSLDGGHGRGK